MQRMLSTEQEFKELSDANPITLYWDRTLKSNRRRYVRLVRTRLKRSLVGMHRARDVRGRVGIFFVHKKNNEVRLIMAARVVNMMFVAPPSVSLLTSEGFAMIEVELEASIDPHSAGGKAALVALGLCLGIVDIADALRRFNISREFSSYFGLMELTARRPVS